MVTKNLYGKTIMKNYKIILTMLALFICFSCYAETAKATQLPQPIIEFIKTKFPNAGIRFDGLVELPDHTTYLPVTPLAYGKVQNPSAVVQTIPKNIDFSQKPDMILFMLFISIPKTCYQYW